MWIDTDLIKTTRTARGNKTARIQINYGSKTDSKELALIEVNYPENPHEPQVSIWVKGKRVR